MVWVLVIKICECEHKWFGFDIVREILRWEHRVKLSSNSNSIPSISITALKIERTKYVVLCILQKGIIWSRKLLPCVIWLFGLIRQLASQIKCTNAATAFFIVTMFAHFFVNILQNFKKTFHWSQTTIKMSYQICTLKTTSSLVFQVETLSFHLLVHLSRQYI